MYLVFRPEPPSRVVTNYLTAMSASDYPKAYSYLSAASKKSVGAPEGLAQTSIGKTFAAGLADHFEVRATADVGKDQKSVEVHLARGSNNAVVKIFVVKEGGQWRAEI